MKGTKATVRTAGFWLRGCGAPLRGPWDGKKFSGKK